MIKWRWYNPRRVFRILVTLATCRLMFILGMQSFNPCFIILISPLASKNNSIMWPANVSLLKNTSNFIKESWKKIIKTKETYQHFL